MGITLLGLIFLVISFLCFPELLWDYGLYWYPFIIITPGLCVIISKIMHVLEKLQFVSYLIKIVEKIGSYSLEIYLIHIFVFEVTNYLISVFVLPEKSGVHILSVVIIPLGCILLRGMSLMVKKFFIKKGGRIYCETKNN